MSDQSTATPPPPARDPRGNQIPGGQVPDPGASALQEGDFGLDGDLRATMLAALEERWGKDDPDADADADADSTAADTDATPGPDPATTSPATTGEDGAGVGGDAGEGAAPVDPAQPPPGTPPTDEDFSLDQYAQDYFGTRLTPAQSRELFGLLGGLQAMSPEQRAQLDAILAGGAPNQYPATTGQPVQPITPGQAATPPATPSHLPPRPPDEDYEAQRLYDQYIAPLATETSAQLEAIRAEQARITQAQLARQQQEMVSVIEAESAAWRAEHPVLSDGEFDALTDKIARSGVFAPLMHSQGNPAAATRAALDQFFWADPTLRARAVANIASGRAAGDPHTPDPDSPIAQQQAVAEAGRQARAASVTGGGGSATPRGQTPAPTTPDARKQAMIQTLAAEGNFS